MTGKNYNWHRAWSRLPNGNLQHISGLIFSVEPGDGFTDINADESTLSQFQTHELARGVPVHAIATRLQTLCREANDWITYQNKRGSLK